MSFKLGEEPINEENRDKVFSQLRQKTQNNACIDCNKKNPRWASVHLGIYLCIDCAGRHRQYGVYHSFVKSTNLDGWNRKQLLYMQIGGNSRAMEFFRKHGSKSGQIDYKSNMIQKYKNILTSQIQSELGCGILPIESNKHIEKDSITLNIIQNKNNHTTQISNNVEEIKEEKIQKKKKKEKKKMGKQINIDNFENLVFDDGVSAEEKQKALNPPIIVQQEIKIETEKIDTVLVTSNKQLNEEQAKKKIQELKVKKNITNISSQQFKDNSISSSALKNNLNKFTGSQSISSDAFFGEKQTEDQTIDKIKNIINSTGGKVIDKISGFWSRLTSQSYNE